MTKNQSDVVAFTWLLESDFDKLNDAIEEADGLPETYASWQKAARKRLVELKSYGLEPRRVYIKCSQYRDWCDRRNKSMNADSLEMFKEIKRQSFYARLESSKQDDEESDDKNEAQED
jgi:hypothetical protein